MALDGILVQLVRLLRRVVKLLSWYISYNYSYELHQLNVIFTTVTHVVSTGRAKTHVDISF